MEEKVIMIKWNKAFDVNGNAKAKVFYSDGTTEMLGTGQTMELENKLGNSSYTTFYRSLGGLRKSK